MGGLVVKNLSSMYEVKDLNVIAIDVLKNYLTFLSIPLYLETLSFYFIRDFSVKDSK